ncbi:MAG: DUF3108 domain-containing protein [Candidatus Omnitrophota bacterium]
MRNSKIFLTALFFLLGSMTSCSSESDHFSQNQKNKEAFNQGQQTFSPFLPGETIKYSIKNLGINAGEATITFEGIKKINGKDFLLIVFKANAINFFDEEKIYSDPETFYPLIVERDLNIFGKKEKITEVYDQKNGVIRIIKKAGGKTTEQTISKQGAIDNIYCFIYRYRQSGKFQVGESFSVKLPTKDVIINLVKETKIKAAGKEYSSYYLQTNPAQYKVWIDTSEKKVPLRINGAVGVSSTAMIMNAYQDGK